MFCFTSFLFLSFERDLASFMPGGRAHPTLGVVEKEVGLQSPILLMAGYLVHKMGAGFQPHAFFSIK